jgi:parallel beta-helix repeat protein
VLRAGDTLYIRGGTYTPGAIGQHGTGSLSSGTSWQYAITIAAYPGETVWLAGSKAGISLTSGESYLIFDGLRINATYGGNVFVCCGVHHIRFQHGELCCSDPTTGQTNLVVGTIPHFELLNTKLHTAPWGYPVYWSGSESLFEGNEVYNNGSYGFHIYGSGSNSVSHNVVRNNTFYNNGFADGRGYLGCAVIISTGSNNQAYNNLFYNSGCGIQVDYRCTGCTVYNNTIYGNKDAGIHIGPTAVNTLVHNNIVYGNGSAIVNWGDAGAVMSHNLTSDPLFMNASAHDFRLQATSPAIDAGMTLNAVSTDFNGGARPQGARYDIGAYEHGSSRLPVPKNLKGFE